MSNRLQTSLKNEVRDNDVDLKKNALLFQPDYDAKAWQALGFCNNYFYRSKENAQLDFPKLRISTFYIADTSKLIFLD